ncbi:MAG: hypothetical protein ACRC23_01640 [Aeromonas jandaei]
MSSWNLVHKIRKVFSNIYGPASGSDNIYSRTGKWKNPLLFISSTFIGGATFGKNVTCNGSMDINGNISYSTSMDEERVNVIANDLYRGTYIQSYDKTFNVNNILINVTYISTPNDPYQGDVGLWPKLLVYVNNSLVMETANRGGVGGAFSSANDIGWSGLVTGDQRGQVTRTMFYSGFFNSSSNVRIIVRNQSDRYSLPVLGMRVNVSTISPAGVQLSKNIMVTVLES